MKKLYPISSSLRQELKKVEKLLLNRLREAPPKVYRSIAPVLRAGGKRLRPLLVLLTARTDDYSDGSAIDAAISVELIHAASLIHDDILDGADTRRGYPTINAVHGYKHAVIAGDYLFGLAFALLAKYNDNRLLLPLCRASNDLSLGELLERETVRCCSINEKDYFKRVSYKTASLFKAACQIGAIIGSSSTDELKMLGNYGYNIGIAFQVYDDILDLTGDRALMGKPIGSDLREGIVTLPLLLALKHDGSAVLQEAIENSNERNFKEALAFLAKTDAIDSAKRIAKEFMDVAIDSIKPMKKEVKSDLIAIGKFVINRYS